MLMRIPRTLALGSGIAIVAVSTLFITSSAVAEPESDVVFVTSEDLGPDNVWSATADSTSQLDGLDFSEVGAFSVRNTLALEAPLSALFLKAFATAVTFGTNDDAAAPRLTGVIELTLDSGAGDTVTLTALNAGARSWTSNVLEWRTDGAFGSFSAGDIETLSAFGGASGTGTIISAAGFDSDGSDLLVASAFVNGVKYLFTPAPENGLPFTEAPITPAAFATDGFTVTTTGFLPNEILDLYLGFETAVGSEYNEVPGDAQANDLGTVTYNWTATGVALPGDYTITIHSPDGTRLQSFEFVVRDADANVDSEAAVDADSEILPATGAEPMSLIVAAGTFGLVGAGILAAIAVHRKKASQETKQTKA